MKSALPCLLLAVLLCAPVMADTAPGHAMMGGMATRAVSTYLSQERSLADAAVTGKQDAVRKMLDDDFSYRDQDSLDALDADTWAKAATAAGWHDMRVGRLVVEEYGDVDVVSFVLDAHRGKGGSRHDVDYVVDVWQSAGAKLLSRHVMHAGQHKGLPPGPDTRE